MKGKGSNSELTDLWVVKDEYETDYEKDDDEEDGRDLSNELNIESPQRNYEVGITSPQSDDSALSFKSYGSNDSDVTLTIYDETQINLENNWKPKHN